MNKTLTELFLESNSREVVKKAKLDRVFLAIAEAEDYHARWRKRLSVKRAIREMRQAAKS